MSTAKKPGNSKVEKVLHNLEHISTLSGHIPGQYMSKRIYSHKLEQSSAIGQANRDYVPKSELENAEFHNRSVCKCKKFGKDTQWDLWKDVLPPVTNTFYYNRGQGTFKDGMRSPGSGLKSNYHHSQKHVSEKFQQFLLIEKLKSEESVKSRLNMPQNNIFNGVIEGSQISKRGYSKDARIYGDEWADNSKQTYMVESENEGHKNFPNKGISTVHGSQWFSNQDGLLDILKKQKTHENRGHSIGYNQNSVDSNGLASGKVHL